MTTYTENCSRTIDESPVRVVNLKQMLKAWISIYGLKAQLIQERSQLSQMSDAMLRDIGIDRVDAEIEANRRDVPASRSHHLSNGI